MTEHINEEKETYYVDYDDAVREYFLPYQFLLCWFTDKDIVDACRRHASIKDIVSEFFIPVEKTGAHSKRQPVSTRLVQSSELDKEDTYRICDVYLMSNAYQGVKHGEVILDLLYCRFPQLKKYDFHAYSYTGSTPISYCIFPSGKIGFVPFYAIFSGDIEMIKRANLQEAQKQNRMDIVKARLESKAAEELFLTIRNLPR